VTGTLFSTEKAKIIEAGIKELYQQQSNLNQEKRRKLIQNTSSNIQIEKKITEYETNLTRINNDIQSFAKEGLSHILLSSSLQKLKNTITAEKNYLDQKAQQEALQKAKFAPFESFISELLSSDFRPSLSNDQKDQIESNGKRIWASMIKINPAKIEEKTILHDLTAKDRDVILRHSFRTTQNIKSLIDEKSRLEKLIEAEHENLKNAPNPIDTSQDDQKLKEIQNNLGELTTKNVFLSQRFEKTKILLRILETM
jgi:DNA sulfur modification protein DndD